ncbi:Cyclic di-GMP phosphodiesterase response regulator RpfG [Ferriphaselus amnicola]|uniref:Cyclic di-GMP phosphodiesterase response regulator RpfG n=1 Tax=Ferriphaselus amnicola TaxID=1188319 RepID=A0A2Z6GA01_9PROT|nr:HD-GYP domain-containing protein [Ferriphaselus amnicola]BBE50125.1 Cyclic di-GMP phosphodiesterase response regulator RpfG [Ferriphaselus amnicola]
MLKKIKVPDVRLGMYLQEICASWMDHPFWRKSFLLEDAADLKTLQTCGVTDVWIDTKKGLDVSAGAEVSSEQDEEQKIESELEQIASEPTREVHRVSLNDEVARARKIHAKAREAVVSMFGEARLGRAVDVAGAGELVDEINQSIARNSSALLSLARLKGKDDYTYLHSVAVCALMVALGRQLGLKGEQLRDVGMAGLLHDVGKMLIPEEVLNKPGRLTDEEFEQVKQHPVKGWELLKASKNVCAIAQEVCLHHHEKVDGSGYPDHLSGEALTLVSRMGAVCDVYDALTSNRCYKSGWEPGEALRKMAEWRNGHFDEAVFHAFVKTVGIYPTNTVVKLKSGRLAVVLDQSDKSLLTPVVKVFFSTRSNTRIPVEIVDLAKSAESIAGMEDSTQWAADIKKLTGI